MSIITEYDEAWTMNQFKEEVRAEGFAEGYAEGLAEGLAEKKLLLIRNLMETLHLSAEEAMDALKVSAEAKQNFITML